MLLISIAKWGCQKYKKRLGGKKKSLEEDIVGLWVTAAGSAKGFLTMHTLVVNYIKLQYKGKKT